MSRNIYDIFNERKSGIDMLTEGFEVEDQEEQFDSLEEAAYAMEEILQENMNECIEFQAASYLEDLVLENMMYESFDEESMREVLTESIGERVQGVVGRLKAAWERIKKWFKNVRIAIGKAFHANEEWILDNMDAIEEGLGECEAKVKYPMYHDFHAGVAKCRKIIDILYNKGKNPNLAEGGLLNLIGVKSRDEIPQLVKRQFMKLDEPQVIAINRIKPSLVISWAACGKKFEEQVEQLQDATDKRFADEIRRLSNQQETRDQVHAYQNFTFITGLAQTVTSNIISVVKKGASDHFQIAKRAMGARAAVEKAVGAAKERVKGMVTKESYEYEDDFEIVEEGLLNKFRKLGVEELEEKIAQLQAAVEDIEAGNGPKKFLKKAKAELKEAKKALASKEKKAGKAEAKAEKKAAKAEAKAAKAEAKAAKKAAKQGGVMPAAESFMLDFDELEFVDEDEE
jgi:hypothetical protein